MATFVTTRSINTNLFPCCRIKLRLFHQKWSSKSSNITILLSQISFFCTYRKVISYYTIDLCTERLGLNDCGCECICCCNTNRTHHRIRNYIRNVNDSNEQHNHSHFAERWSRFSGIGCICLELGYVVEFHYEIKDEMHGSNSDCEMLIVMLHYVYLRIFQCCITTI